MPYFNTMSPFQVVAHVASISSLTVNVCETNTACRSVFRFAPKSKVFPHIWSQMRWGIAKFHIVSARLHLGQVNEQTTIRWCWLAGKKKWANQIARFIGMNLGNVRCKIHRPSVLKDITLPIARTEPKRFVPESWIESTAGNSVFDASRWIVSPLPLLHCYPTLYYFCSQQKTNTQPCCFF